MAKIVTHLVGGAITINDTRTLAEAQAAAVERAANQFASVIAAGRNYNGKNFQIDDASRINIGGASTLAVVCNSGADTWDPNFYWRASDNTNVPLATPAAMIAFASNTAAYYSALSFVLFTHKANIAALTTNDACDAYDVTTGWPAN